MGGGGNLGFPPAEERVSGSTYILRKNKQESLLDVGCEQEDPSLSPGQGGGMAEGGFGENR